MLRVTNLENLIDLNLNQIFRCLHSKLCPNMGKSGSIYIILTDRLCEEHSYKTKERAGLLICCVGSGLQSLLRMAEHSWAQ